MNFDPFLESGGRTTVRGSPIGAASVFLALLALAQAVVEWQLSFFQRGFIDALIAKDLVQVRHVLGFLALLIGCLVLAAAGRPLARACFSNRSRRARFGALCDLYFSDFRYAIGQQAATLPEVAQRLADDVEAEASLGAELTDGAILAMAKFILFGALLWRALPFIEVGHVRIAGPLFWFTLASSASMLVVMHWVGGSLPRRESARLECNAVLRSGLARVTEYALSIALLDGGAAEAKAARERLGAATRALIGVAWVRSRMAAFQALFSPADLLIFLLLAPSYFRGELSFGTVFQISMAYNAAGAALGWFVAYYGEIAQLRAARSRIRALATRLEALPLGRTWAIGADPNAGLAIGPLSLQRPPEWSRQVEASECENIPGRGELRIRDRLRELGPLSIDAGERVLLMAPSGFGKSLLFASLRGCWPWVTGPVSMPREAVWIPQKPYLPHGTLLDCLNYPRGSGLTPVEAEGLLEELGLGQLVPRIGEAGNWGTLLSGGELARLALIRAVAQRPRWIFMDEPTAALDRDSAERFWRLVERLESVTIVLIAHSLAPPYDRWRCIHLQEG